MIAAEKGVIEIVHSMLTASPKLIHEVDGNGRNLAHVAIVNKRRDVLKYLFGFESALLKEEDGEGNNALHFAAKYKEPDHTVNSPAVLLQAEYDWYKVFNFDDTACS